jgi:hypothetical protein
MSPYLKTLVTGMAWLARRAVSGDVWALIVIAVNAIDDDESLSNTDKKATVLETIQMAAPTVFGWLLSIAIDVAVGQMRVTK